MGCVKVLGMATAPQQMFGFGPFTCGMSSCVFLLLSYSEGKVDFLE